MNIKLIPVPVVWVVAAFLYAPTLQAGWIFAMLGDTRGVRGSTQTGVSTELDAIAQKIASLNPDLVLVAGDLVNGNDVPSNSTLQDYALQYTHWKTAMQPVFDYTTGTGIPIYPVRGNHDNNSGEGAPIAELKQAYFDAFSAYVPANGPNDANSGGNQVGFSYSFTHNNVSFVAADLYFYPTTNGYHSLYQDWVTQQFQQSNSPYKIFMAHVPMFMTEGQRGPEHFFGDNLDGFQTRAKFWDALGASGIQLYLTGHVHTESVASTTNDYGDTIIQLMAGNGGAPLGTVVIDPDPGVDVLYTNGQFGFSLATVEADAMTIQYYSLNPNDNRWTVDSYATQISPNASVPEPSTAILLASGLTVLAMGRFRGRQSN